MTTLTNTIYINKDQYLSDVADQLPKTPGIHLIDAKTGVGKTTFMMKYANENNGVVIFPVKSIVDQQKVYAEEKGYANVNILQIEHIKTLQEDFAKMNSYDVYFFDEAQLCYTSGYRESVEDVVELIQDMSERVPFYLLSATVNIEMMPFKIDTVTRVVKPFNRELNVITMENAKIGADAKSYTSAIPDILNKIKQSEDKPILCFLNDSTRMEIVADKLKTAFGMTSICIESQKDKDTKSVYDKMISEKTISSAGVDVVLSTIYLGEGIDFFDDFHCVSIQCESGFTFQQLGRARKDATWWLIAGNGTANIFRDSNGNYCKSWTSDEGEKKGFIFDPKSTAERRCKWHNKEYARTCNVFSMISNEYQKTDMGFALISKIEALGYTLNHLCYDEFVKIHGSRKDVSKKVLRAAIEAHGIPTSTRIRKHPFIEHLDSLNYTSNAVRRCVDKLIKWENLWEVFKTIGIEANTWDVYFDVKTNAHKWVEYVCADPKEAELFATQLAGFREASVERTNRYYSRKELELLSNAFWERLMPRSIEDRNFYRVNNNGKDTDKKSRDTLFAYLVGFKKDDSRWKFECETTVAYSVDLNDVITPSEKKRFNIRVNTLTLHGQTPEAFCKHFNITKKQLADLRIGEVRKMVTEITKPVVKTANTQTNFGITF